MQKIAVVAEKVLMPDQGTTDLLALDFFALFQEPRCFLVDPVKLTQKYHQLISVTHPDRFANKTDIEKEYALLLTARINEARKTLSQPLERACYLLLLQGIDIKNSTDTTLPKKFLIEQITWRESIDEARYNSQTLNVLLGQLKTQVILLTKTLEQIINKDLQATALLVKKWCFFEKLIQEIYDAKKMLLER